MDKNTDGAAKGCDCGWTNNGANCGSSDGSICYKVCCNGEDDLEQSIENELGQEAASIEKA